MICAGVSILYVFYWFILGFSHLYMTHSSCHLILNMGNCMSAVGEIAPMRWVKQKYDSRV